MEKKRTVEEITKNCDSEEPQKRMRNSECYMNTEIKKDESSKKLRDNPEIISENSEPNTLASTKKSLLKLMKDAELALKQLGTLTPSQVLPKLNLPPLNIINPFKTSSSQHKM